MSNSGPDVDPDSGEGSEPDQGTEEMDSGSDTGDSGSESGKRRVERSFTCTVCGYPMTHEAGQLQTEVASICHNCGDWTTQSADFAAVVDEARDVAGRLAGTVLTERQALADLLREVVGVDRGTAAEEMDSTPSNVDNLHRRATEKVDDARRLVDELERLPGPETDTEPDRLPDAEGGDEPDRSRGSGE